MFKPAVQMVARIPMPREYEHALWLFSLDHCHAGELTGPSLGGLILEVTHKTPVLLRAASSSMPTLSALFSFLGSLRTLGAQLGG